MRNTILALVLAAGALGAATTASEAGYGHHGYGYGNSYTYSQPDCDYQPTYGDTQTYSYSYQPTYTDQPTYTYHQSDNDSYGDY